jgi:hypothetical protein
MLHPFRLPTLQAKRRLLLKYLGGGDQEFRKLNSAHIFISRRSHVHPCGRRMCRLGAACVLQ